MNSLPQPHGMGTIVPPIETIRVYQYGALIEECEPHQFDDLITDFEHNRQDEHFRVDVCLGNFVTRSYDMHIPEIEQDYTACDYAADYYENKRMES